MTGDLRINLSSLIPVRRRLDRLGAARTEQLLDILGSELESQTRRRITEEKTGPDGATWDDWSSEYAAHRPAKGGKLELEGHLRDSITYEVTRDAVIIGSNLVYAAVHQDGSDDGSTPARPYLGVSDQNLVDLGDLTMKWLAREFGFSL